MTPRVPARAERLLRWSLSPLERPAILGDLEEEYAALAAAKNAGAARRWYWRQVVWSIAPNLRRRLHADLRRERHFHRGLSMMALGVVFCLPVLLSGSVPTMPPVLWLFYGAFGAGQVAAALFHKRLDPPQRNWWTAMWLVGAFVALISAAHWQLMPPSLVVWTSVLVGFALAMWPHGPAEARPEVRVGPRQDGAAASTAWSLELPTEPLGLSGLVLHRPRVGTARDLARLPSVTIERIFTPEGQLRVRAAVNLSPRGERASVELLDRQGRQIWQVSTPVIKGKLVEVPASLDDIADRDAADHFGLIDETLELSALASGPYRLRVTVSNDIQTSSSDEYITIAQGPRR